MTVAAPGSGVTGGVLAITLLAAVLHATWNAMAHGVRDRLVGFALIGLTYTVLGGAVALVLGPPPDHAWTPIIASASWRTVTFCPAGTQA